MAKDSDGLILLIAGVVVVAVAFSVFTKFIKGAISSANQDPLDSSDNMSEQKKRIRDTKYQADKFQDTHNDKMRAYEQQKETTGQTSTMITNQKDRMQALKDQQERLKQMQKDRLRSYNR